VKPDQPHFAGPQTACRNWQIETRSVRSGSFTRENVEIL
jgi:hypothetical protein